jgi:hypothetical protein
MKTPLVALRAAKTFISHPVVGVMVGAVCTVIAEAS